MTRRGSQVRRASSKHLAEHRQPCSLIMLSNVTKYHWHCGIIRTCTSLHWVNIAWSVPSINLSNFVTVTGLAIIIESWMEIQKTSVDKYRFLKLCLTSVCIGRNLAYTIRKRVREPNKVHFIYHPSLRVKLHNHTHTRRHVFWGNWTFGEMTVWVFASVFARTYKMGHPTSGGQVRSWIFKTHTPIIPLKDRKKHNHT